MLSRNKIIQIADKFDFGACVSPTFRYTNTNASLYMYLYPLICFSFYHWVSLLKVNKWIECVNHKTDKSNGSYQRGVDRLAAQATGGWRVETEPGSLHFVSRLLSSLAILISLFLSPYHPFAVEANLYLPLPNSSVFTSFLSFFQPTFFSISPFHFCFFYFFSTTSVFFFSSLMRSPSITTFSSQSLIIHSSKVEIFRIL